MIKYLCDLCCSNIPKEQLTKVLNVNKDTENDKILCVDCFRKMEKFLKGLGLIIESSVDLSLLPLNRGIK